MATLTEHARRRLCRERWNIGFISQRADDIVRHGVTTHVRWLSTLPAGMLFADPAYLETPDGQGTVFVEAASCHNGRGEIWWTQVGALDDPAIARFRPLLTERHHMSYPFPFRDEVGRTLFTCETWQAGCATIRQQDETGWPVCGRLLEGRPVLDPTLWRGSDRWWLFCTFQGDGANSCLYVFFAETLDGPWTGHPQNPIVADASCARPAGPLFIVDGRLIRPAQDCSYTYGGAVVLNWVRHLDAKAYVEEPLRRLEPRAGPYGAGLHTFCPAGDFTIIDGKTWRFDPVELTVRLARKISAIGSLTAAGIWKGNRQC